MTLRNPYFTKPTPFSDIYAVSKPLLQFEIDCLGHDLNQRNQASIISSKLLLLQYNDGHCCFTSRIFTQFCHPTPFQLRLLSLYPHEVSIGQVHLKAASVQVQIL